MTESAQTPAGPAGPEDSPPPAATDGGKRRRGSRRAVRRGTERETHWGVSADESGGHGSNDDRLRGDVPPHW